MDDEAKQAGIKVVQAVEKLRRLVIQAKSLDLDYPTTRVLAQLLHDVATCFNSAFQQVGATFCLSIPRHDRSLQSGNEEFRSAVLDALLVLSKSRLAAEDPTTYTHAYEDLEWAYRTTTASPTPPPDLKSEYLRCVSGAYHTIGATLCQAERFGGAARFLQQACELGASAVSGTCLQNDGRDKQRTNLLQNLYRRWEMLGACHIKIGDRKVRYL
jgi:separase